MANPDQRDAGASLIEVMVAVALLGVMMAIAVSGWMSWARASEHSGAARHIQSMLRQAQQRAVTEGVSMCVEFDTGSDSFSLYQGSCSDPGKVLVAGPSDTDSRAVHLASPAFSSPDGTSPGVTFTARGTAWPGEVQVTRDGSTKTYRLTVEGLTGRVALS
jgi:Tfp pilus assembly protein FimT